MADNLMAVVMQFLTPEMITKIATVLGLDRSAAQKATGAALPTLLASLASAVSGSVGADKFSSALAQQPTSLDSLTNLTNGADRAGAIDRGSNVLANLLGGNGTSALVQSFSRFTGMSEDSARGLFGMLAPVVLGAFAHRQRAGNLDPIELVSALRSQKNQLAAAIPSGLADQLSAAGLFEKVDASMSGGVSAASAALNRIDAASEQVAAARSSAGRHAIARSAASQWPYYLLALAVLGGLLWYVIRQPSTETVAELQPHPPSTNTVGMATQDLTVGGVNLATQVDSSVDTLKSVLPTVTDATSASAGLPKIKDAIARLDDVKARAQSLSPEKKAALAKLVAAAMPAINQMCDRVLAMPGAGDIAKPSIEELRRDLDTLAKA